MNKDQKNLSLRDKNKKLIVEQLKKTPIIQVACEKLGIARASFYRWRKDDKEFAEEVDKSLCQGKQLVNEMAESQLIKAIREGNLTSIIFWLKNNSDNYRNRIEVTASKKEKNELTPEQKKTVRKALELGQLIEGENINQNKVKKEDETQNKQQ